MTYSRRAYLSAIVLAALLSVWILIMTFGASSKTAHAKTACTGFCNETVLEQDIWDQAQKRLDNRFRTGKVTDVMCVPERELHYRCSVDIRVHGRTHTEVLNITVSPDHSRWIS